MKALVFTVIFTITANPTLNAADPYKGETSGPRSLAESLFQYACDFSRAMHERPLEERAASDYRRALDAFRQVTRLNTDTYFSAESLARMAELYREMADATGDSALYQQAIETFRRVADEHPQSNFVGDALISIAQIYEESLQDLEGAAAAYRELIHHFPTSVMAREARAVLARFDDQLGTRPPDVLISSSRPATVDNGYAGAGRPRLTNVRNFTGPDYARVVIDLSDEAHYSQEASGDNRLLINLGNTTISPSLYGRRFIVGNTNLLKRIIVTEAGGKQWPDAAVLRERDQSGGVQIQIEVSSLSDYSAFRLSDPARIVIDLHSPGSIAASRLPRPAGDASERASRRDGAATPEASAEESGSRAEALKRDPNNLAAGPRRQSQADQKALLSLPEITDPILPLSPADAHSPTTKPNGAAEDLRATIDAKAAEAPLKRIVIDPGHGGHDTGTISAGGLKEKDLVLDVARRLKAYIRRNYPDIEVVLTRESDRFIALEERTAIANSRRADLFISVHANASQSRAASGVETYFMSSDRAPLREPKAAAGSQPQPASNGERPPEKVEPITASVRVGNRVAESRELARYIQAGLVRGIGAASPRTAANRGVKHAAFVVLLGAAMPSVLAEVSFMSNPRDEALLQTSQFRERIAASLFAGLNAYLKKNRTEAKKQSEVKK